jgi:hypothetical protein
VRRRITLIITAVRDHSALAFDRADPIKTSNNWHSTHGKFYYYADNNQKQFLHTERSEEVRPHILRAGERGIVGIGRLTDLLEAVRARGGSEVFHHQ